MTDTSKRHSSLRIAERVTDSKTLQRAAQYADDGRTTRWLAEQAPALGRAYLDLYEQYEAQSRELAAHKNALAAKFADWRSRVAAVSEENERLHEQLETLEQSLEIEYVQFLQGQVDTLCGTLRELLDAMDWPTSEQFNPDSSIKREAIRNARRALSDTATARGSS